MDSNIKDYIQALFEKFKDRVERNKNDIKEVKKEVTTEIKELRDKISKLESRQSVAENDITQINKKLDNIQDDITWTKRAVIGAVIVQIISLLANGGG